MTLWRCPLLLASLLPAQTPPTEADFELALARYRALVLPEPPDSAPLVLLSGDGSGDRSPRFPAFLLPQRNDGTRPFLRGTKIDGDPHRFVEVSTLAAPLDASQLLVDEWLDDFERDQHVAIALQLWARGRKDLARHVGQRTGHGTPLVDRVTVLAARHWYAQIVESDLPLPDILRHLRAAVALGPAALPCGASPPFCPIPTWDDVLTRLERAATPPVPPPDPRTALVLALVHSRTPGGFATVREPDAPFRAVVDRAFDIVPTLLAHLDDDRVTRALTPGFNNLRSYVRPLGEVVGDALLEISGDAIPASSLPTPRITRADAEAWWEQTQTRKEDEYLLERFRGDPGGYAHSGVLRILAARYPERLELALLELVQQHPERLTHGVVEAIADGSMRVAKKVELLERIASTAIEQRLQALRRLAGLEELRFCARLCEVLAKTPSATPPSVWTSPDARFGHLVVLTRQPEVWQAFLRLARRAEVGLRMELMNPFDYTYLGDRQRNERIACLAAFLDDAEVYDVAASGQEGPHAAFTYARLAMRDFAASKLALLLGVDRHGAPDWTEAAWAALRTDVRLALQRAGIAAMPLPTSAGR